MISTFAVTSKGLMSTQHSKWLIKSQWLINLIAALALASVFVIAQPSHAVTEEFSLPPLPYAYDALNPVIDTETMMLHHDKHHAGYVKKLNAAVAQYPELQGQSVKGLLQNLDLLPADIQTTVRNNGGGHANHTLFWTLMSPEGGGEPTGPIAAAIASTFGDFESFKQAFNAAGKSQFGSGWAWLVMTADGDLKIKRTPNQDSPYLTGDIPILGNDVWEHAYYLNYRNDRGAYLQAWWKVINWDEVNRQFEQASAMLKQA